MTSRRRAGLSEASGHGTQALRLRVAPSAGRGRDSGGRPRVCSILAGPGLVKITCSLSPGGLLSHQLRADGLGLAASLSDGGTVTCRTNFEWAASATVRALINLVTARAQVPVLRRSPSHGQPPGLGACAQWHSISASSRFLLAGCQWKQRVASSYHLRGTREPCPNAAARTSKSGRSLG